MSSPYGNSLDIPVLARWQNERGEIELVCLHGEEILRFDLNRLSSGLRSAFRAGQVGLENSELIDALHEGEFGTGRGVAHGELKGGAFLPLFRRPGKIVALGRTFPAHAAELGNAVPKDPLVFNKYADNIIGDGDDLPIRWHEEARFDNEVELGALVAGRLEAATAEEVEKHVAGWFMLNDFTDRRAQGLAKKSGHPWLLAKNPPGAFPIGSLLARKEDLPDPRCLKFTCRINDEVVQENDFQGMGRSPYELIAWLSHVVPLAPGDLVALGTPKGVTSVRPNDALELSIDGLGYLRHRVVEDKAC